jgi:phage RecT family recombinase
VTTSTKPSTALATTTPRGAILATVEQYAEQLVALAPRGVEAAHYLASLRLYLAQNDKVMNCSPASIARGMLRVAQTGLELGVSCDLLPFGNDCQFSPRYNGIIELALASGARSVNADVVREGEVIEVQKGTEFFLRHRKYDLNTGKPLALPGAPIIAAYAVAELKPGSFVFETATRDEIEKIRLKFSKQWAKGSLDDIPWYAKKRMVRALSPFLPKNARFAAALAFAAEAEAVPEGEFEVAPSGDEQSGVEEV